MAGTLFCYWSAGADPGQILSPAQFLAEVKDGGRAVAIVAKRDPEADGCTVL